MSDESRRDQSHGILRQAGKGGPLRLCRRLEQREAAIFLVSQNELKTDDPVMVMKGLLRVAECDEQPLKLREDTMSWIARAMQRQPEIVQAVHEEDFSLCEMLVSFGSSENIGSEKIRDDIHIALFFIAEHCDQCNERVIMLLPGLGRTIHRRFEQINSEPIMCYSGLFFMVKLLNRHFNFFWKCDGKPPWSPKKIAKQLWHSALLAYNYGDTKTPLDIVEFLCEESDVGPSGAFIRALYEECVSDEENLVSILKTEAARLHTRVLHLAAKDTEERVCPQLKREAALFMCEEYDNGRLEDSPELLAGMVRVAASEQHPQAERQEIIHTVSGIYNNWCSRRFRGRTTSHNEHVLLEFALYNGADDMTEERDVARNIIRRQAMCRECHVATMTILRDLGPVMCARFGRMYAEPFSKSDRLVEGALEVMSMHYNFYTRTDRVAPWNAEEMARTIWTSTRKFFKDEGHFTVEKVLNFAALHSNTPARSVLNAWLRLSPTRTLYEEIMRDEQMMHYVYRRIAEYPDDECASYTAEVLVYSLQYVWQSAHFPLSSAAPLLEAIEIRLMKIRAQPSASRETNDLVCHLVKIVYFLAQFVDCQLFQKAYLNYLKNRQIERTALLRSLFRIGIDPDVWWATLSRCADVFETLLTRALEQNLKDMMDIFLGRGMLIWLISLTTRPHNSPLPLPRTLLTDYFRRFPPWAQKVVEKFADDPRASSVVTINSHAQRARKKHASMTRKTSPLLSTFFFSTSSLFSLRPLSPPKTLSPTFFA